MIRIGINKLRSKQPEPVIIKTSVVKPNSPSINQPFFSIDKPATNNKKITTNCPNHLLAGNGFYFHYHSEHTF